MTPEFASTTVEPLQGVYLARLTLPVLLLTLFWLWETRRPFFGRFEGRWRHAGRNVAFGLFNGLLLGAIFGTATVLTADWTTRNGVGLLNRIGGPPVATFIAALVLLDGWMYVWHRANHVVPLLWRFHRMHHSDNRMDVTTASRFHLGELAAANMLRLGLIVLLGFQIHHVVVYEMLVVAITQFHHADVSLGRFDRPLRWLIVTPDMHKMHHSRWRPETDSNYSTFLSVWDRLARSFRMRDDTKTLNYGLDEFDEPGWQSFWGMLKTPFAPGGGKSEVRTPDFEGNPERE